MAFEEEFDQRFLIVKLKINSWRCYKIPIESHSNEGNNFSLKIEQSKSF